MEERHEFFISAGTVAKVIVVALLFIFGYYIRDILLILLLAVVVASAIEPAAQWLIRRKVPRLLSVILVYLTIIICLIAVILFLLLPLLSESINFLIHFPAYLNASTISQKLQQNHFFSSSAIADIGRSFDFGGLINQINVLINNISSNVFGSITNVFGGIFSFILLVVLSFYMAVEEDGVAKFLKIVAPLKHERYIIALWKRSQRKIGLWLQGQLVLAVIIGLLVFLGLTLLSVPNALLLAFLAGLFEIIPLFGPILSSIPSIAIALTTRGFTFALVVVALYIIVHQLENQLIYPLVVKKIVGLSPIISIVALIAGWEIAGFLGLILAVPVASVVIEFFDDYEKDKIERFERMNGKG